MGDDDIAYVRVDHVLATVVVLASLASASVFVAARYYCYLRRKSSDRSSVPKEVGGGENGAPADVQVASYKGLQVYAYKKLHSATGGFSKSNVVGQGAFGSVYRGVLGDGRKVGVKSRDQAGKQGEEEFKVEVHL